MYYATPALTWMGPHLILGALDYIIQMRDEDFHVYFRENLLFNKGFSVSLSCLVLLYFPVNEQNLVGESLIYFPCKKLQ